MGDLEIKAINIETSTVSANSKVITQPAVTQVINPTPAAEVTPQEKAKKHLSDLAGTFLDADFLQTSVVKKKGADGQVQYYLRISRPWDDKNRLNDSSREKLSMGYIRKHLGVKGGVISANNDSRFVADRPPQTFHDGATIDTGKYLDIPVSELGQEKYFWCCSSSKCEELKAAAKKLEE